MLEGFYYHYYFKISQVFEFLPYKNQSGYNSLIWFEMGLVEFLQILLIIVSLFFLSQFIKKNFNFSRKSIKIITILYMLGLLYYFFEEISWGQHIFYWQTPNLFTDLNHQNETNLHNISSLFNELPRNLLLIWCSFSYPWNLSLCLYNRAHLIKLYFFLTFSPRWSLKMVAVYLNQVVHCVDIGFPNAF